MSQNRLKAEADLEWLFSWAEGDLGVPSAHGALIASIEAGPRTKTHSDGNSAHHGAIGRMNAVARFRHLSSIVNQLPVVTQHILSCAFSFRRWSPELARRQIRFRYAALECKAVREYLGGKWTLAAAERLLVAAEKATGDDELKRIRLRAWPDAERSVDMAVNDFMRVAAVET